MILLASFLAVVSVGTAPYATRNASTSGGPFLGTLLIRVSQVSMTEENSTIFLPVEVGIAVPLANVSVAISTPDSASTPLRFLTNQSGEILVTLSPGSYAVSVSNAQFQKTALVTVNASLETEVSVTSTKHSYPALFVDLPDPYSSASVAPWNYLWMAVAPSASIPLNGSLFVEVPYGISLYDLARRPLILLPAETRVRLVSSALGTYEGTEALWLTLQPGNFLAISGAGSLSLAIYTVAVQVTMNAN